MKPEPCNSWEEFDNKVKERIDGIEKFKKERDRNSYPSTPSSPIFRGQGNSKKKNGEEWKLKTTLERQLKANKYSSDIKIVDYHKLLKMMKPEIKRETNKSWILLDQLKNPDIPPRDVFDGNTLTFMTYLRHIGFPSPLLDWTYSPYVAAFFAFRDLYHAEDKREREAVIYMFIEDKGEGKGGCLGGASPHNEWKKNIVISTLPDTFKHHRHLSQKAQYTYCICAQYTDNINSYYYASHEDFLSGQSDANQDELVKYTIPVSECGKVLNALKQMKINSYSLFNTEESLAEKLAMQELNTVFHSNWLKYF